LSKAHQDRNQLDEEYGAVVAEKDDMAAKLMTMEAENYALKHSLSRIQAEIQEPALQVSTPCAAII
jgi:hypothetical protein